MADFLLDPETQAEPGAFIGGLSCRGKEGGSVIDASEQRLHGWPAPSHAAVLATPKTFAAACDIKNRSPRFYPIRRASRWPMTSANSRHIRRGDVGASSYELHDKYELKNISNVARITCNFILDSVKFLVNLPNLTYFQKLKK